MGPDDQVPQIGRGPLFPRFPAQQLIKIMMMILALVAVVMLGKPCANGVAGWFNVVAPTGAPDAGR